MALTAKQERFIAEYLIDCNASGAIIRAGYKTKNPDVDGYKLLVKPSIQLAIQEAQKKRSERTEITQDMVLQRWWDIATADPNEIVHIRRVCCRHCFGIDHKYQWRDNDEYDKAVQYALDSVKENEIPAIPSGEGGFGFDRLLRPHPKCPVCNGEGSAETHIEDTRHLSQQAKLLYAGVKQTTAGIEIRLHDQGKALENVAKHIGMFVDKSEISIKEMPEIIIKRAE
jgi:phage terminase small subunit